ncbi:MAG: 5-(carboxyamino)imidazole ribonucleotide mutase [Patescibacteria group bacterium]
MSKTFVGIVMGSDSDLAVMADVAKVLEQLGVESEMRVLSAHRVPEDLVKWIRDAEKRGCKVFVAGAGMAAALPGTVAAHTSLPVIGVPLTSVSSVEGGLDAILSILQMPPGVPVATVGLNGGKNAGVLAAQIIGAGDSNVLQNVRMFKEKQAQDVLGKDKKLQEKGYKGYLEEKK